MSFQELEWREREKQEKPDEDEQAQNASDATAAEETEDEAAGEHGEEAHGEGNGASEPDRSVYARLLTEAQKQSLMDILLARRTDREKEKKLSMGDKALIEVVSKWGDHRFARYLLDQIRASSSDAYFASDLMSTVARILADEELEKMASKFSDVFYQDDDAVVEEA